MGPLRDLPELDTDLETAVAALDKPRPEPTFTLDRNRFHAHKAAEKTARRDIKRFIRPENARAVLNHLPAEPGDRTHCVLRGDFVLCDLIAELLDFGRVGPARHVRIATLGMSAANADALACLVERARISRLTIVVSHYFQQLDKATTFQQVATRLSRCARLVVTRSHAKVILIPTVDGRHFVIEGSANLRSSDNLEQIVITNDRATHDFHAEWIDQLASA